MIGTIRKHQQWLWAIIITITIASFIFWTGNRGVQETGRAGDFGTISGEKVTKEDYLNANKEVLLQYFFMSGRFYNDQEAKKANFNLDQRIYMRLLLIQKEEQFGIRVSSEKAGQFATQMIRNFERGALNPNEFDRQVLQPQRLTMEDFDRFVRHELGIQELMNSFGLGGKLITAQEAQELYRHENQALAAEAVTFSASNYLASITAAPEAVGQFYSNQVANYRLPERVQVAYVRFPYTNYYAAAEKQFTNLTQLIEDNFQRLGTNKLGDAKTPEEKKAKIKDEIFRRTAAPMAQKDANQFAGPLFENNPLPLAEFSKLAKSNSLEVAVSEPFGREETPKALDVGLDFARAAFSLSPAEAPYAQPIIGRDAIYVMAFEKRLPSEIPSFEQIKDKVTTDYKMVQAALQARKAGIEFSQSVSNGLAQGKSFDAIAAEAKAKVVQLPPLSLATREVPELEEIPLDALKEIAFSTPPGKASPFRPMREGGIIVHIKSKLPLDEAKMKTELPQFTAYVRQARQREAFEFWFRKEIERARIDAPILRRQQQEAAEARS
jgi:hypothetical protein